MIKQAWDSVSTFTICNCYRQADILPKSEIQGDSEDDMSLLELRCLLRQVQAEDDISAEVYVSIDNVEETGQQLQDADILTIVRGTTEETSQEEEEEEEEEDQRLEDVTLKQARDSLGIAIAYFEQTAS